MQESHIKEFLPFVLRSGMYVVPVSKETIMALVHGYELSERNNRIFTDQIKQILTEKHDIRYTAYGWPGQIEEFALQKNYTWVVAFKKLCSKFFIVILDLLKIMSFMKR